MVRVVALSAALFLASCGPQRGTDVRPAEGMFSGRVTFDARHATPQGVSEAITVRPARFVDVALVDALGRILAEGHTDADGRFALSGPPNAARLRVSSRIQHEGHDVAVTRDPIGRITHTMEVAVHGPSDAITAHAIDSDGHAGAFHVVDTLYLGLRAVHEWTGEVLPPVFAYWVRGGTREWSYYRGERPAGSGRYALELLGGDPGEASTTDTDEHDEAIVLHELGHFVMDRLSGDSSTGGMHPRGARIDPGTAWEEGRASWFAISVLRQPFYRDTIGVEPWGRLRVDENLESDADPVAGLASETSVSKVLWDLTDGLEIADVDGDGVAIGPAAVLNAMIAESHEEGAFPSLPSFVSFLARTEVVPRADLEALLLRTGEPAELLLPEGRRAWPDEISPGERRFGRIDGLTQPAPSGGPNLPVVGWDAIDTYRVRVEEPGMLTVRVRIDGSGHLADHQDLDLEILDLRADSLADSRSEEPVEVASRMVAPGFYVIRVRDGGDGNRATYQLEVLVETL